MRSIIPLIIVLLFMCSCKKSNEALIKCEFMTYVNNNFDDPESFQELVSIEPKDTVSVMNAIETLKNSIKLVELLNKKDEIIDSVFLNTKLETITAYVPKCTFSDKMVIRFYLDQLVDAVKYKYALLTERSNLLFEANQIIDSVKYESPKYGYEIKFRQIIDKEVKLHVSKAYVDSLSRQVYIKPTGWQIKDDEASDQLNNIGQMLKKISEFVSKIEKYMGVKKEIMEKLESKIKP